MRTLILLAGVCGLIATASLTLSQSPAPCDRRCQNWYAGGADLYFNNPFARFRK